MSSELDATVTISVADDSAIAQETTEAPRLILSLDCRDRHATTVRFCLASVDEVAVGRGPARRWERSGRRLDIQLVDHEVSRQHASLRRSDDGWEIADLASKNRTVVNGAPTARALLVDGDVIEIGGTLLVYRDDVSLVAASESDLVLDPARSRPFSTVNLELELTIRGALQDRTLHRSGFDLRRDPAPVRSWSPVRFTRCLCVPEPLCLSTAALFHEACSRVNCSGPARGLLRSP